jgi:hypothetical protein
MKSVVSVPAKDGMGKPGCYTRQSSESERHSTSSGSRPQNAEQSMLTPDEEAEARKLYEEFWQKYPDQKNPSDINTPEKANFLIQKGFERVRLMQRARKQAYSFTRPDDEDEA